MCGDLILPAQQVFLMGGRGCPPRARDNAIKYSSCYFQKSCYKVIGRTIRYFKYQMKLSFRFTNYLQKMFA